MNERLIPRRRTGNTAQTLRTWALLFLAIGIVGRSILELKLLGMGTLSDEELLESMGTSNTAMILATAAIVMQLIKTCAVPLFAFLLVEGVQHTASFWNYFLRVAGLALVSEIPYDLAMYNFSVNGSIFNWADQNPVFGLLLCMVMIYLYKHYAGRKLKNILICGIVAIFAVLWAWMLKISEGVPLVLIVTALWFTRGKQTRQVFVGAVVACLCIAIPSPSGLEYMRYLASPMVFLMIFRYNGEPGEGKKVVRYGAYPVMLIAIWAIAAYAI